MFESVRIQNFRQFRDIELKDLGRINLITGKNSAGKTSLLEAVYLLDGPFDPSRTVTIAQYRGIGIAAGNPELWDWLFHNRNTSQPIKLSGKAREGRKSTLSASLARGGLIPTTANGNQGGLSAPSSIDTSGPSPELHYETRIALLFAKWGEWANDQRSKAAARWVDGLEYGCLKPELWGGPTGCTRQCTAS